MACKGKNPGTSPNKPVPFPAPKSKEIRAFCASQEKEACPFPNRAISSSSFLSKPESLHASKVAA